jgi:hypothetical protein
VPGAPALVSAKSRATPNANNHTHTHTHTHTRARARARGLKSTYERARTHPQMQHRAHAHTHGTCARTHTRAVDVDSLEDFEARVERRRVPVCVFARARACMRVCVRACGWVGVSAFSCKCVGQARGCVRASVCVCRPCRPSTVVMRGGGVLPPASAILQRRYSDHSHSTLPPAGSATRAPEVLERFLQLLQIQLACDGGPVPSCSRRPRAADARAWEYAVRPQPFAVCPWSTPGVPLE